MNKLQKISAFIGAMGATVLMTGASFATPAYEIDTGVQTGITDLLSSFVSGAFLIIVVALGLIGSYWVTVRLVHVLIKWFHKFGH